MAEPFVGQIEALPFAYAPRGWALCQGQLLPIQQNQALFSLLGTTYGGDGQTTFALPDLRGRVAPGYGAGPGLSNYTIGAAGGQETHVLQTAEVPSHGHTVNAFSNYTESGTNVPGSSVLLGPAYAVEAGNPAVNVYTTASPSTAMGTVSQVGGQAHENRMPFLVINYCIALIGIFPSQN